MIPPPARLEASFVARPAPNVVVRADLSLDASRFRVLALFGPSGAGKTTILRALLGIARPTEGSVSFDGVVWSDASRGLFVPTHRRSVGYVSQEDDLFPHLTAAENAGFGAPGSAAERSRIGAEALERFGLRDVGARLPRELSGGQRRRVALVRALARRPRLLLLDEPSAGLDAAARSEVRRELRGVLAEAGTPAVMVSHDPDEVFAFADDAALVSDGRVVQQGPVAEVFTRPNGPEAARLVGVETVTFGEVVETDDGGATVCVGEVLLRAFAAGVPKGPALVCIRAEDVLLERAPGATSARNVLPGRVAALVQEGARFRVVVDVGFPLAALVTRAAAEDLGLVVGAPIHAVLKAPHVHLAAR